MSSNFFTKKEERIIFSFFPKMTAKHHYCNSPLIKNYNAMEHLIFPKSFSFLALRHWSLKLFL